MVHVHDEGPCPGRDQNLQYQPLQRHAAHFNSATNIHVLLKKNRKQNTPDRAYLEF